MCTTSAIDPPFASPRRATRCDEDAAAPRTSRESPPLDLPPPAASSIEGRELRKGVETELRDPDDGSGDDGIWEEDDADTDVAFRQMMDRGGYLRSLRLLALADEQERQARDYADSIVGNAHYDCTFCEEKKEEHEDVAPTAPAAAVDESKDDARTPPTKEEVLDYDSYLAHQRYYDDLKHVDFRYVDFGDVADADGENGGRLVVEQRKSLGKGGFCWDAGFVLGEHVVARREEWMIDGSVPRIVELGAGTGLAGLMIAKATESHVTITDLPELEDLMRDNVRRNFDDSPENRIASDVRRARGTIASRVLRWGAEEDYGGAPYDVVVGADIVTSLYDPRALARTLHALSGPGTRVYVASQARLDRPHEEFDAEMGRLFERVERVEEPTSRLRSPDVFITVARGKKRIEDSESIF